MEEWRVKFFHLRLQREMLSEILPSRESAIRQARALYWQGHRVCTIVGPTEEIPWENIKEGNI